MSTKNSSNTNENRTRDFPACRAVSQSNVPPRTLQVYTKQVQILKKGGWHTFSV